MILPDDLQSINEMIERVEKKLQECNIHDKTLDGKGNLHDVTKLFDLIDTLIQTIDQLEVELDELDSRLSSVETLQKKS